MIHDRFFLQAFPMTQKINRFGYVLLFLLLPGFGYSQEKTGEQIYKQACARCHGANGEGVPKKYDQPLIGHKSLKQLTSYIARTMPEDDPGSCTGPDAEKVAAFIFEKYYSEDAQSRNKPPRIELSRLTVKQYRNAVFDLVNSFRFEPKASPEKGLKGEYFNARNFRNDKKALDRVDAGIDFDWGLDSPLKDKIAPEEFTIRWNGSVLAPETGEYEFVVQTDHGFRLWVNDLTKPLIDGGVKSGTDTEFTANLFLLAGRTYSLRLEFIKAKQGVDDTKKNPPKPRPAMLHLLWKRPGSEKELIPARLLTPAVAPERFVISTPFPPDDRSLGWERGTAISKAWDSSTTDAALDVASYIVAKIDDLAGSRGAEREKKIREFCGKFAERAFRKPLTADEKRYYIDRHFEETKEIEPAVKRLVLFALKSPRFLYREVGSDQPAFDAAARLSFALWDSIPDQELWNDAVAGKLKSRDDFLRHARRMVADPKAKAKLHEYLLFWVKADQAADLAKDPKRFPDFDESIIVDLKTSLELFLDEVAWSEKSDFRQLITSETVYLNGRLANYYGVDLDPKADFQKLFLQDRQPRSGILTHPYLMSRFAYTGTTSPIHRGVFLARGVLGITLRPPQEAFTPLSEDLHPGLTTRERVALQTKGTNCQSCHSIINTLGFTLEMYDPVGRYREKEQNKPLDTSGSYLTRSGETVKFNSVKNLADFLSQSEEVHTAFADRLFQHLVQQPIRAYGPKTSDELKEIFKKGNYSIRNLLTEIAVIAAMKK
jgi:hypothetical protein